MFCCLIVVIVSFDCGLVVIVFDFVFGVVFGDELVLYGLFVDVVFACLVDCVG